MEEFNRKEHWEKIYTTKELPEVSWHQPTPEISLQYISQFDIPKNAKIIDVGGGDSFLVDHLLDLGFTDITVLDISEHALERAKKRLGERSKKIKWIIADIASFTPSEQYDFWHDRAAFHFLTNDNDITSYVRSIEKGLKHNGNALIGTFSEQGPKKCSGIEITQYSEASMTSIFSDSFNKISCVTIDHPTPFGNFQNFIFCSFKKK